MKKFLQLLLLIGIFTISFTKLTQAASCGETFTLESGKKPAEICDCNEYSLIPSGQGTLVYCCGSYRNGQCYTYPDTSIYTCGETLSGSSVPEGKTCNCAGAQWESYWSSSVLNIRGLCCGWTNENRTQCLSIIPGSDKVSCGQEFDPDQKSCVCSNQEYISPNLRCCGWYRNGECKNTDVAINDVEVTAETLAKLNPLSVGSSSADLSTPGGIISRALRSFIFPIAGAILFIILVLGGFQMLSGANNSKSLEEGKQRITSAIIGFMLLFAAYWIAQLLEIIFGIRILS